ncbi:MAG TPA: hypothetical protein VMN38_08260 [Sphingomicrobium sp.]|nr:hypothetical protein [Sphingomicrobium sp.]
MQLLSMLVITIFQNPTQAATLETVGRSDHDQQVLDIKIDGIRGGQWQLEDKPERHRLRMKDMKQREYCLIGQYNKEACVKVLPNEASQITVIYNQHRHLVTIFGREGWKYDWED